MKRKITVDVDEVREVFLVLEELHEFLHQPVAVQWTLRVACRPGEAARFTSAFL